MRRVAAVGVATAAMFMGTVLTASAATSRDFADWGPIGGTSNDFTTTMQLPAAGFPEATVTSDSRADIALPTGATNWFGENTPPGQRYGSSRDQAYLNLRPRADNASSPSTTTYTFERGTPQGWAFVLGDIDADQVRVSATRADGTPATTADLGFRSAFNLCDTTPRPSGVCAANGRPKDVPTWDTATATLIGNTAAVDSDGATGWFEPTTSLRTLTFTFTRRGGFPVFQTWFAVTKQDVTGTVDVATGTCTLGGAEVSLLDAEGTVLRTEPVTAGAYSFTGVAASYGYRVALSGLPDSCIPDGPSSRAIDLSSGDVVADFTVRQVIPVPISGQVTSAGEVLAGVAVTLTPAGGGPAKVTTTDVRGYYVFDDNADNTTYTISVTPPDGYLSTGTRTAVVPDNTTTPVTGQDFVLPALPTVSGAVDGPDGPLGGVTVELTGGGQTYRAVTAADGTYALPRVPSGSYALRVPTPPAGYSSPAAATVTVGTADVTGQDIALSRVPATGSVAGIVTLDGAPLAGVAIAVRPTTGSDLTTSTDAEGTYGLGGLTPGAYTVVITPPSGSGGTTSRPIVITSAGDSLTGVDFALTTTPAGVVPVVPAPDDPVRDDPGERADDNSDDPGRAPGAQGVLPDAGGPSRLVPLIGLVLVAAGTATAAASRVRRRGGSRAYRLL